jgi:hypothetical protein
MKINNYLSVVLLGGLAVLLVGCSTIDKNTTSDIED